MTNAHSRTGQRTTAPRTPLRTILGGATMLAVGLSVAITATPVAAQITTGSDPEHELIFSWDRWLDHDELNERMEIMADQWPEFLTLETIGQSYGGRDMKVMTINNPETGDELDKAAMFVEANVHGNEIQGGEVVIYTIWYLMENYDRIPEIRRLVDERVFYLIPSVNPDGRDWFMDETGSGARTGHVPVDSDGDGLFDEDGPNDLNGNGVIEQIRKYVPGAGDFVVDPDNPNSLRRVGPNERGDYILLGSEGLDDDGDGRVNEDPPGGYDPNRNYPSDWQPQYVQGGAMNYPFELPEPRAIEEFMVTKPNIAGSQSYHNTGGMILRGPGAAWYGDYPQSDVRVYNELGENGERMLPWYDYFVVWQGLYAVHGGQLDWANDGHGAVGFSNELWNGGQYYQSPLLREQQQDEDTPIGGGRSNYFFDDFLTFGRNYVEWAPFDHPQYGEVEMGGFRKLQGRVNPRFMSMELFHRNMAFTLYQADEMPLMSMGDAEVEQVSGNTFRVRVPIRNERLMPTILERARRYDVVEPDILTLEGADVLMAGWVDEHNFDGAVDRIDQAELDRILIRSGHPGRTTRYIEYLVQGSGNVTIEYSSQKGGTVSTTVGLN